MRAKWIIGLIMIMGHWAIAAPAGAATFSSGSTGANGPFNPSCSPPCTVTVTLPASGTFNYTTGNIPPGVTVKYTKNTTNTGGGFGAAGAQGQSGAPLYCDPALTPPPPGPGGAAYGHPALLPLLGGSGGGGGAGGFGYTGGGGGGGGGALLVASSGTITFTGVITANGGGGGAGLYSGTAGAGGGGSGGGVRLVATTITGTGGSINVNGGPKGIGTGNAFNGGDGGVGRIRVEAYTLSASIVFSTYPSLTLPGSTTVTNNPTLTISAVGGVAPPGSPAASYGNPDVLLVNTTTNPVTVNLSATNIPVGTTVTVRVIPQEGASSTVTSTALSGTLASSTATATITMPLDQPAVLEAEATF
jgi:hypothetical protein